MELLTSSCKRCAKAGRKCEGFPQDFEQAIATDSIEEMVRLPERSGDSVDGEYFDSGLPIRLESSTNQELRFLGFFYQRTAPHISGFFDGDFYNKFLLQAGQYEPAIRYAMMACGAMHEHYEFEVVPALDKRSGAMLAPPKPPFALSSYNKAISALMKQLSSGTGSVESVTMCCLLFTCLECLRGDPQSAAAHLRSGGSILASWMSRNKTIRGSVADPPYQTPSTSDPHWIHDNLIPIFQRLGSHVMTAGRISSTEFNTLVREDLSQNDPMLAGFETIDQARNTLMNLCALAARYVRLLAQNKYDRTTTEEEIRALLGLRQKVANWDRAMSEFLKSTDDATRNSRRALVLLIQRRCYNPVLGTALLPSQCAFDDYNEDYTFVVRSGERLLNRALSTVPLDDRELETFSFEEGITPACYYVATKCRDPILRRVAVRLLKEGPARQGIWNSRLFAKVAERHIEIEENYKSTPPTAPHSPMDPNMVDPSLVDTELYNNPSLPMTPESLAEPSWAPSVDSLPRQALTNYSNLKKGASSIPEEARIHVADIRESPDGNPHQHSVTFLSRPNGLQADWKIWTEQVVI